MVAVRIERSKAVVSKEQRTRIQQLLTMYRTELCMVEKQPVPLLYGPEIATGITNTAIRLITDKCALIRTSEQLIDIGITSDK